MARPFRFQPPSLPVSTLVRARLLAQLAARWERRLVTVVAGPGFGKTVLLAGALADAAGPHDRRDIWLGCEPSDASAEHLLAGLAEAMGLASGADLDALCDWVWSQTPNPVCVMVDDVHEIPRASEGSALLERLVAELPGNGHVVLSSRDPPPVPTARLAASGQLVRLGESELLMDPAELAAFALVRNVDSALLASSGGWPALAELTATAGADLVLDYLWEEVLARIGPERTRLLAQFALVGGGDDAVVSALAQRAATVDDLVAGVPLVIRTSVGWAALHALWRPPLQGMLSEDDAAAARHAAAAAHRRAGRYSVAIDVLVEGGAWTDVLAVIREAVIAPILPLTALEFGRCVRSLPHAWRDEPEALMAAGMELRARSPHEAIPLLEAAAKGFRDRNDVDGELAAIFYDGAIRWTANDVVGLLGLHSRLVVLASAGSRGAQELTAVAAAAMAHISGDSAGVLGALDGVGGAVADTWLPIIHWLRSVAHRRDGDLRRAYDELDAALALPGAKSDLQLEMARLRIDWLGGRVDHVLARLRAIYEHYVQSGERFLATESGLELAAKAAFLGELDTARDLLDAVEPQLPEMPGPLARILRVIATAVVIGDSDESRAAALMHDEAMSAIGQSESWYWRDRAAIALVYVLVPETRDAWRTESLGPAHLPGLVLAEALTKARGSGPSAVSGMPWPPAGVIRAHLPLSWVVELAIAGRAAGNPPPDDLLRDLGDRLRPAVRAFLDTTTSAEFASAAKAWLVELPAVPAYSLRVDVLGPLRLCRDGEDVVHADLRRQRVRELLCSLVAHRRARREAIADELWPDVADPGRSLRVTLSYLQRALQPERPDGDPPYFVRTEGTWLVLAGGEQLAVDTWELDVLLDDADAAERANAPAVALSAYRSALPLWRGDPFADALFAGWALVERARLAARYVRAATRAGELLLATGAVDEAISAAERALVADATSEPAYRLLVRAHLAQDDSAGARRALERCQTALAELDLEPDPTTLAMITTEFNA